MRSECDVKLNDPSGSTVMSFESLTATKKKVVVYDTSNKRYALVLTEDLYRKTIPSPALAHALPFAS